MRLDIILIALVFQLVLTTGIGLALRKKSESSSSYLVADRALPLPLVVAGYCTFQVGALTTIGYLEMGGILGMQSMWHTIGGGFGLVLGGLVAGPWYRRVKASSMPEIYEAIFGLTYRLLIACVLFGVTWGIITLEAQAGGLFIAGVTGVSPIVGIVIMLFIGLLYLLFAGMRQVAYLNLANYGILLIGGILLIIFMGREIPGGWLAVGEAYKDMPWFLNAWAIPWNIPDIAVGFSVGILLACLCMITMPALIVTAIAAKDEKTIRKAGLITPIAFFILVFPWLIAGVGVTTLPVFAELGPKFAGVAVVMSNFPAVVSAIIFVAGLGAILSTFSMCVMGCTQIFTYDIYKRLINPDADTVTLVKVARLTMIGIVILVFIPSAIMPVLTIAGYWLWPWFLPPTFALITGLFWKRATIPWLGTTIIVYLLNTLWTFTPLPSMLGIPEYVHNVYIMLLSTLIIGGLWTAFSKSPPGIFVGGREISSQAIIAEGGDQ